MKFSMDYLLRTIATMTVLTGISSTTYSEEVESCTNPTTSKLKAIGKRLGKAFQLTMSLDENRQSSFYEEFGFILSEFKSQKQIREICSSFYEEILEFDNPSNDAMVFTKERMRAWYSENPAEAHDVDAAFYEALEKFRKDKGEKEANRFANLYEYSTAGAMLGSELAEANRNSDQQLVSTISAKAEHVRTSLSNDAELLNAFSNSYTTFSC